MPGGGLPWQVKAFAGGGEGRMPAYKVAMALGAAGAAWWWWSTSKHQETLQAEAVDKFGRHGEKAEYGKSFQEKVPSQKAQEEHFPGIPATETNAAGGHAGSGKFP